MFSIKKSVLGLGLLTLCGVGLEAGAAQSQSINTPGSVCNPFNANEATDIDYVSNGVRTIATSARRVVCGVGRHPVAGPGQSFFVDGSNSAGKSTLCALSSFTFQGTFNSATSFLESSPTYDHLAALQSVGRFDYVTLLCNLPANAGGVLFGVITVDN
jgi:hypothetical protein